MESSGGGAGESGVRGVSWRRSTGASDDWADFYRWLVTSKLRIPTGFPTLDRACAGGFQEGWLVSFCGVDQAGKSNILLSCALEAVAAGFAVGLINLDMDWRLWFLRMIAKKGNISASEFLEKEQLDAMECSKIEGVMERLQGLPGEIILDESMPTTISDVRKSIGLLVESGARMVVVDYLQLISADHTTQFVQEFDEVVKGIRRAALQHRIPILCAAQLNRKAKEDDAPHVFHVLGGTALERHGDINIVIDHRKTPIGSDGKAYKQTLRIEKNRPVGRLYEWDIKFDVHTMQLTEIYSPQTTYR